MLTVDCMNDTLLLLLILTIISLAVSGLLITGRMRRRAAKNSGRVGERGAVSGETTPMDGRIEKIADAYADGGIDPKMLKLAAKTLNISVDEAERRLQAAGGASHTGAGTRRHGGVKKDAARQRSKQQKQARRKNRR